MALPALVAGGLAIGSTIGNWLSQSSTNKSQQQFALDMYEKQKADNLSLWHLQNEYNSPMSQRQRMEAAGFNPALMYGNGVQGNTASPVSKSDAPNWNPQAPQLSGSASLSFLDASIKEAQFDNLKAQNEVLRNEAMLKNVQALNVASGTSLRDFEYDWRKSTRSLDLATKESFMWQADARANLLRLQDNIGSQTINESIAAGKMKPDLLKQQINESVQRIKESQGRLKGIQIENNIKRFRENLASKGINESDPTWMRLILQNLHRLGIQL